MRTRIIFSLKNRGAYVPFHHQYLLAQFIKGLLLFGPEPAFRDYTRFNFSGLKGQTKVSRKGLHFYSSKVTLVFSCTEPAFRNYLLSQIFGQKDILIGSLHLVPDSVEDEPAIVMGEESKLLCISPIVPIQAGFNDDRGKRFIHPESDEFSDLLYESTIQRMEASGQFTADELSGFYRFQVVPDHDYLQRMQQANKKYARIYPLYDNDVKFEVRGYTFPFTLYAARQVQQFIYENGLGYFCHKGFGMLDMVNNNPAHRNPMQDAAYA
ncbi:MAG: CRISPR-associated protein Cas6 [Cyclobacteriaceae bacterium]|nr:CRISPR-associated protein Cas6 [Cyclobacteriaceae bacterium]MCX7637248.1 CRISPR-associated protein Cas6 [Cyclobacteriaceae bacterium]MDW8331941.1 CRISPR-associated endoribonuclease Cas6 [Cyclobacteriaceae bacterium]